MIESFLLLITDNQLLEIGSWLGSYSPSECLLALNALHIEGHALDTLYCDVSLVEAFTHATAPANP